MCWRELGTDARAISSEIRNTSSFSSRNDSIISPVTMRSNLFLSLVLTFLTSLAIAAQSEQSVEIFAWPISASKSQTLAKISYNTTHATVKSYNAPKIPAGDEIVRIGFNHQGGSWSGVSTASSNFAPGKAKSIQLHVNQQGQLYHVGFKASDIGQSIAKGQGKDDVQVEVVKMQQGPSPHLNKPVVLNADGKVDDKEAEKTFFQK
jgi:5-hydroxyisourate hydrolase-like protein (transthyretin family)